MIELQSDSLVFTFPDIHRAAKLHIDFQRTLRIPDDGREYPLPPGLGRFPLRHVDDFGARVPGRWIQHGGVMLPMYQSEALWLNFSSWSDYPFAVKIATGLINAVTGKGWENELQRRPQDYLVVPTQPWLDGYCVKKGIIRQFVAMPLGAGYTVEEQLTDAAEHGGLQIVAYPMKAEAFEDRFGGPAYFARRDALCQLSSLRPAPDMGLAPGGRMRQEIYDDPFPFDEWDTGHRSRCFVHLCNSLTWRAITGSEAPTVPFTSEEYTRLGLPWFEYYVEGVEALEGGDVLAGAKSVKELGEEKGDNPLPENVSVDPTHIVELRKGLKEGQVREGRF
jgi:hypothetical protein